MIHRVCFLLAIFSYPSAAFEQNGSDSDSHEPPPTHLLGSLLDEIDVLDLPDPQLKAALYGQHNCCERAARRSLLTASSDNGKFTGAFSRALALPDSDDEITIMMLDENTQLPAHEIEAWLNANEAYFNLYYPLEQHKEDVITESKFSPARPHEK